MDLLGETLAALSDFAVSLVGQSTLVNGVDFPGRAEWTEAQPNRITTFLAENEWAKVAYDVVFPASVLEKPWRLANGSEVTLARTGVRCVVRRIDIPGVGDTSTNVMALVVVAG